MYHGTMAKKVRARPFTRSTVPATVDVERVQTGVRIEKRMLKVLKAVAEYKDMSLSDLLEGIILHAFESKPPFSAETMQRIEELKKIYGLRLDARASHRMKERP